ncbi:MAG: hypothetical protein ABWY39_00040 [Mycobacterium sp.]
MTTTTWRDIADHLTPEEVGELERLGGIGRRAIHAVAVAFREVQQMLDELLRRQSGPVSDDTAAAPRKTSIIHRVQQFRSG